MDGKQHGRNSTLSENGRKNQILFLSAQDVKKALPIREAIHAMRTAFRELSANRATVPLRTVLEIKDKDGVGLFMPAYLPGQEIISLKTVTVHRNNPQRNLPMIHALVTVFDAATGRPLAVMDGEELTAIRTGAAAGLATDLLARKDAAVLAVVGAGRQATNQVSAVYHVRNLRRIFIIDLDTKKAQNMARMLGRQFKIEAFGSSDASLVKEADIICTVTSSLEPVFDDKDIQPGTHINAMGAYRPEMQEIPAQTLARSLVVTDSKQACLQEAGDLIQAIKRKQFSESAVHAEFGEIISGKLTARKNDRQITLFESVGNALQDLMAAKVVIENAKKLKVGRQFDL